MSRPSNAATTGKLPSYPLYPRDMLADVLSMSDGEEVLYRRLLDYQWLHGSVPSDPAARARAGRMAEDKASTAWLVVAEKFPVSQDGALRNGRMERIREEQIAYRDQKSAAGKAAAAAKRLATEARRSTEHQRDADDRTTTVVTEPVTDRPSEPQQDGNGESTLQFAVCSLQEEIKTTSQHRARAPVPNETKLRELLPATCHDALRRVLLESGRGAEGAAMAMCQMLDPEDGTTGPDMRPVTAPELAIALQQLAGMPSPGWNGGGYVRKAILALRAGRGISAASGGADDTLRLAEEIRAKQRAAHVA